MFLLSHYLENVKYAGINFGEAGNPIEVSMYNAGSLSRRNIYDDRGFVSSTEVYDNGIIVYTDYLTEKGNIKLREYAATGRIEINEKSNTFLLSKDGGSERREFKQLTYDSMKDVIMEVMTANLEARDEDDVFCVAMHE